MKSTSWMSNNTLLKESFKYDPKKDYENDDDAWYELTVHMSKKIDKYLSDFCREHGIRPSRVDKEETRNALVEMIQNDYLGDNYEGVEDIEAILQNKERYILKSLGY